MDLAKFRPSDIDAVYGSYPLCFLTGLNSPVDAQHILGRGFVHGVRPGSENRRMFSSIFNCAPLIRPIHAGALRDSTEMRFLLLRVAREHVMNAIALGNYEITELDREFLAFAGTWRAESAHEFSS